MTPWYIAYNAGIFASAASVLAYGLVFRRLQASPLLLSLLLGATLVSLVAFILETWLFTLFNAFLSLVVIAPIIEESLKFGAVRKGMNLRAALGVGMGFAFMENALYFGDFLSVSGVSIMTTLLYFLMRGASDPLLHSYTTAISLRTWQTRKLRWFVAAIGMHAGYNLTAIIGGSSLGTLIPVFLVMAVMLLIALMLQTKRKHVMPAVGQAQTHDAAPASIPPSGPNYSLLLGNLKDPSRLTEDQLINNIAIAQQHLGFAAVAGALGLEKGYERTSWVRHSTYHGKDRITSYWEFGRAGIVMIAAGIAVAAFFILEVVI